MSSQRLALHAHFPPGPTDHDGAAAYDGGAALVGLVVHGVERGMYGVSRHYGEPGGGERLLSAPAFRITEDEHGAIVMLLSAGPWEDFSRSRVAAHLGVTLRPVDAFNPATGGQFRIPWR